MMSDKALFLAILIVFGFCGMLAIRWLLKRLEIRDQQHTDLLEKMIPLQTETTAVLKEVRDVIRKCGGPALVILVLALLSGCETSNLSGTVMAVLRHAQIGYESPKASVFVRGDGKTTAQYRIDAKNVVDFKYVP